MTVNTNGLWCATLKQSCVLKRTTSIPSTGNYRGKLSMCLFLFLIFEHQFKGGAFHAANVFCCFEDPDQLIQLVLVTCMEEIAMLKHERICQNKTKFIFPGLFYQRKENILKQLKEFNCVPANDCVYEWFIVFDFEAILRPEKNTPLDRK